MACVEQGMIDTAWLDLGRSDRRQAAFPEAHAFLVESGAARSPALGHDAGDWLLIEGGGDGYRRAGWIIRQDSPWSAQMLESFIGGLSVERKKGLFLTDSGWLAVNQTDWAPIAAPEDARSRLELIDSKPLDTARIDKQLKQLVGRASVD